MKPAVVIFAAVYLVAFAMFSPLLLIARVDARHQTERTTHAEFSER